MVGSKGVPGVKTGTLSITAPTAMAADSEAQAAAVTLQGLDPADTLVLLPSDALEAGLLLKSWALAANQVTARFRNTLAVAGPATAARSYNYIWLDLTP